MARYQDLTAMIGRTSIINGDLQPRGGTGDLVIDEDAAEPVLGPGEQEVGRVAGVVTINGPRRTSPTTAELVAMDPRPGSFVVTTERLIGMFPIGRGMEVVDSLVLPWDLVDDVSITVRRSAADRIAGGRTIKIAAYLIPMVICLVPAKKVELDGTITKVRDGDVMTLLARVAAEHRLRVLGSAHADRLQRIIGGTFEEANGDHLAAITPDDGQDPPEHLVGRLVWPSD